MLGIPFGELVSQWTDVNGLGMHARVGIDRAPADAGDIVFVHGIGVSSRYMVPLAAQLAASHRVYAVDLPGFGRSDKPRRTLTLSELADALGDWLEANRLSRPALYGNSFGCQVIAELGMQRPGSFACAILQGPTIDPLNRTVIRQLARWALASQFESKRQAPLILRDYLDCGVVRLLRTFRFALDDRIEQKLPHLDVPVLVIRGTRDPITPERWAEDVVALLPRARLAIIPAKAHTLNFSAPLELSRVIRPFVNRHAESTTTGELRDGTLRATLHR